LPNIKKSVGISESKYDKGGVDAEYTLDILCLLLNVMRMKRAILGSTDIALPIEEIRLIFLANNHGIGKKHLFDVR
jgi:hypothetical protein